MNYHKIIKIVLFVFLSIQIKAQVQVNLNVDSNPTPELFEWVNRANLALLTVTNSDENLVGHEYFIKVKLLLDGNLVLETNNSVGAQRLVLGSQTFLADEVIPYDAIDFKDNKIRDKMTQTGLLPAGFYSFCVSLYDINGEIISTPREVCATMIITDYVLPELLYPIDNVEIESQLAPAILFTWTPVSPLPQPELGVKYILAISEVFPEQSVSQAFHVNYPLIEEEVLIGTQFAWSTDLDIPDETTQYVWSIKPVTINDNPYKAGVNGFSYIQTFTLLVADEEKKGINQPRVLSNGDHEYEKSKQFGILNNDGFEEDCDGIVDFSLFKEIIDSKTKSWEDATAQAVKEASKQKNGAQNRYKIDDKLYYYTGDQAKLNKCFNNQESLNNSPCKRAPYGCYYTKNCKLICRCYDDDCDG